MQLQENQFFASHYRLERLLGRGGFSEVWLAYDETADVKVAIKVYAPGTGLDNDGVELFRKEFKIVFDMNHTNLLCPKHFDVVDNMPYLVMPFIERGSTNKMIGKLPETEVWKFIRDVASGLAYLHSFEPPIIHQDIKPDNVMLMNNGTYVITDFGISTRARSTLRKSVNANENAGTQAYMGPERFSKQPAPIKASDVWSLGATVFELMEGYVPFGDFGGINQKSGVVETPEIEGAYSDDLKELVYACLAMETWNRPTAEQLSDYASDKLKGRSPEVTWKKEKPFEQPGNRGERKTEPFVKPKPEPKPKPTPEPKKKNLAWLWILLVVVVLGGTVFGLLRMLSGVINGHAYVDLGLPSGTLWATCNVGANSPEDYGNYYAWGETTTKSTYNWGTYKYCRGSYKSQTKYCTNVDFGPVKDREVLEMTDDAAHANWGGSWRMPTYDELNELKTKCTWTWTNQGGKNGYRVTGPNGKSIFLPAAGYRNDGSLNYAGSNGDYWSSSLHTGYPEYAYYLYFNSGEVGMYLNGYRRYGQSVRPVSAPQN